MGRCNDVLLLDLASWQWSRPLLTGTAPSPRQGAALAVAGALIVSFEFVGVRVIAQILAALH